MALEPAEIEKRARLRRAIKQERTRQEKLGRYHNEQGTINYKPHQPDLSSMYNEISINPDVTIKLQNSTVDQLKNLSYNIAGKAETNNLTYDGLIIHLIESYYDNMKVVKR